MREGRAPLALLDASHLPQLPYHLTGCDRYLHQPKMAATASQGFFAQFRDTTSDNDSPSFSSDTTAEPTMQSRKRSRDPEDLEGETEIESASSSFRQSIPKRLRVTLAQENGGQVVSDDEEVGDAYRAEDSGFVDGSLDLSDVDDEDDDIDELQAAKIVQKQIREHRQNVASECGVIEEVLCRNFMCHSKLRIKIGPLINFVIGHNGSGKSAVLTALTMCLGGSAKATNRGTALRNLIKEGEESCTLAVRIKNQGDGAYKPDDYGRSITVERHFTRSGGSTFKIKNSEDRIVTQKKAELDDILDFFAFQLDNPINVLTQDLARQFLSNSSPADKYKFFIRGTQLETLDHDYKTIEEYYDSILARLESMQDDIGIYKRKEEQAKARKNQSEQASTLRERIGHMKDMHAWSQVEVQEEKLEKDEQNVRDAEAQVSRKEEESETISAAFEGHDQAQEAAQRSVDQLKEAKQPLAEARDERKAKFQENRDALLKLKEDQRKMKEDIRKAKQQVNERVAAVETEQERISSAGGPAHAARLERLEELKEAVQEAKTKQDEHAPKLPELKERHKDAFEAQEHVKGVYEEQRDAVREAQTRLQGLKRSEGREFDGYKPNMEQLVRAVNAETRWREKPTGPLGKHVRLRKPSWGPLIEKHFGPALDGFATTNTEDQRLLSSIAQRVRCDIGVFQGNSTPMNTAGNEPEGNVDTIMNVLEIDNDLVRNQLIITMAIDQVVLVENQEQAMDYMYPTNRPRPRNVKSCITWTSGSQGNGIRYEHARTGAEKSSPLTRWNGDARMKTDRADQVRMQEEVVSRAKREVDRAEKELRSKQVSLKEATQAVNGHNRRAKELLTALQQAEDAVEALQNEIESNRPQDGRLQELERQLQEKRDDHENSESAYQDSVVAKDSLNEAAQTLKAELDAAQREYDDAANRLERAERKFDTASGSRTDALAEKNRAINAINNAKNYVEALEKKRDDQRKHKDDFVEAAQQICHRIPVEPEYRNTEVIDERIERLTNDLARAERQAGGSHDDLVVAYTDAQRELENAKEKLQNMKEFNEVRRHAL